MNKGFPYFIISIVIFGWIAISLPRMIFPPILPLIEKTYSIPHAQAGLLMSIYMLPYALMQVPTGFLIEKFGKKRFMVASTFGSAIPACLMSFVSNIEPLLLLRFIQGLFSGMWYSSSTTLVTIVSDEKNRGKRIGLSMMGGPLSTTAINLIVGLIPFSDWRNYLLLSAIPGIICGFLIIFRFREENKSNTKNNPIERTLYIKAIKIPIIFLSFLFSFTSALAGWGLMTFVPTYLVSIREVIVSEASLMLIFFSASSVFAGLTGGLLTDRFGVWVPAIASAIAMCSISFIFPVTPLGIGMAIVFIIWGLMGGMGGQIFVVLISRIIPLRIRGAVLGSYNFMGFLSATIGPVLFGYVADIYGFTFFFQLALALQMCGLIIVLLMIKLRNNIEAYSKSL